MSYDLIGAVNKNKKKDENNGYNLMQYTSPKPIVPQPLVDIPTTQPIVNIQKPQTTWDKIKAVDLKGLLKDVGVGLSHGLSRTGAVKQNKEIADIIANSPLLSNVGKDQQTRIRQQGEFLKANPVNSVPAIIGEQIPQIPLWLKGEAAVGLAGKGLLKLAPKLQPLAEKASTKLPGVVKGGLKDTATYGTVVAPVESINQGDNFGQFLDREKQLPGVFLGGTALRGVGTLGKGVKDSLGINPYARGKGLGVPSKPPNTSTPPVESQPLRTQSSRIETESRPSISQELPNTEPIPRERQFAQNVRESQVASGEVKANLDENPLTYEPITNKETFNNAKAVVEENSAKARELFDSPSKGVSAEDVALGEALITKAIKDGDTAEANKLIADLAEKLTTAGQAVQAASIFKRLSPEGMLLYAQRVVNSANKDLFEKLGTKAKKVELTQEDSQFITDAMRRAQRLDDGREKDIEIGKVMKLIADKLPASLSDKVKGIQRISLLLNPKTMVRNLLGNTIFGGIDNLSNVIATPIDKAVGLISKKRTTTLPSFTGQLKSGLRGARETIEDAKLGIDTYSGKTQYELPSGRVFNTKALRKLDQATKVGLQLGDRPFYNAAYDDVLRQQMKLAKVDKPTQEMIEQAHQAAQQRTYQDVNALTNAFKMFQSALNGGKEFGLGNIVLPFVKTPANILKRAIEYSPIGVERALREATKIGRGKFDQKAFVDSIARSVTGTAIIMVGYDLAKQGVITGSGNKDKDVAAFERGLGKNDYAFKVDNKYYTYDWAQPISMAMAIGADIYLKGKDRKEAENVVTDAVKSGGETLFKQSVMQGLQRFMGGYTPVDNIAETLINAPTQLVPTFSNQLGQASDDIQRTAYDPTNLGTGKNLLKARIPGLNKTLEPKIDTSGNTVKRYQGKNNLFNVFVNPSTTTTFKPNKVQSEILRLYESTGDKAIFPQVAPRSLTHKGQRITLTPREITEFQRNIGKQTERNMEKIVGLKMPDKKKVDRLEDIIKNSYDDAKIKLLRSRGIKIK